jgi:hypothetical protein
MQFTTLIPAYKPKYMIELLSAIRHQTVKPAKVIISDDSPDQAFLTALTSEPLKGLTEDLNIQVFQGPRVGAWKNFVYLLNLYGSDADTQTELFHILLDDDFIYPNFYERHLYAHCLENVPCVISRRWTAVESGQPVRDNLPVPPIISGHAQRIVTLDAGLLFSQTAATSQNWLGEFSNATFTCALASDVADSSLAGVSYSGLEDLGAFLKSSLKGQVAYINEYLGYFRINEEQHSANPMGRPLKLAFLAYAGLAISSRKLGFITNEQSHAALNRVSDFVLQHYSNEQDMTEINANLSSFAKYGFKEEESFLEAWHKFVVG